MLPSGKVVMFCGSLRGDAEDCVNWAVNAICDGADSPSLRILAGLTPPLSPFEVREYALKALRELDIYAPTGPSAISAYAHDLVKEITDRPESMQRNLKALCDLCIAENYQGDLFDFYLLRWAYDDLRTYDEQRYWDGADRSNIEEIVLNRCRQWLAEYQPQSEQSGGERR